MGVNFWSMDFWVLLKVLGIFWGFDYCPNSIIPVTWNPEYPPLPLPGCNVDTIYITIDQVPTSAVKDTAHWLLEHRKLTLPLRPWKIVSPSKGATVYDLTPLTVVDKKGRMVTAQNENRTVTRNSSEKRLDRQPSTVRMISPTVVTVLMLTSGTNNSFL